MSEYVVVFIINDAQSMSDFKKMVSFILLKGIERMKKTDEMQNFILCCFQPYPFFSLAGLVISSVRGDQSKLIIHG